MTAPLRLVIEGGNIRDIASLYDEFNRVFMVGEDWTLWLSLDALNDLLYGGYGAMTGAQHVIVEWRDMEASRSALGVEVTLAFLEERITLRPMFNGSPIDDQIAALRSGHGKTYFDIVMDVFADHANVEIVSRPWVLPSPIAVAGRKGTRDCMARKLKVFRTPIGFHDAYVAAPSQKAALEAWGSDADLFARGAAERVTDEALTREPLDNPGKVIRRARGTAAEHMAALPTDGPKPARRSLAAKEDAPPPRKPSKQGTGPDTKRAVRHADPAPPAEPAPRPKPRPSRAKLDEAEQRLEEARKDQAGAIDALREQERALQAERRTLERRHDAELKKLEASVTRTRDLYQDALTRWRQ